MKSKLSIVFLVGILSHAALAQWKVTPDPVESLAPAVTKPLQMNFPFAGRVFVVASARNNSLLALGDLTIGGGPSMWQVLDLSTGKLSPKVKLDSNVFGGTSLDHPQLSPDGKYVAFSGIGVSILPLDAAGKVLQIKEAKDTVDFVAGDKFAVKVTRGTKSGIAVWDMKTGQQDHEFLLPKEFQGTGEPLTAVSPGGHQVAVLNTSDLAVIDLDTGNVLASEKLPIPTGKKRSGILSADVVAFSPDGTTLAAFTSATVFEKRVIEWNVADGTVIADLPGIKLDAAVIQPGGRGLQFFPEGHKVRFQRFVIDPEAKSQPAWSAAPSTTGRDALAFSVFGDNALLVVGPEMFQPKGKFVTISTSSKGK